METGTPPSDILCRPVPIQPGAGAPYACSCSPGWGGSRCETDADECASSPCAHGSTCRESGTIIRVRVHIIRNARLENVGKSQSCMVSNLRIIWKQTVEQMIRCFFIRRSFIIHSSPPADSVLTECHPTASATVTIEVSRRFVHAPKYQYHYCMLRTRLAKAPTETADRVACKPHAKSLKPPTANYSSSSQCGDISFLLVVLACCLLRRYTPLSL